jgi:hypothetical protein
MTAPLRFSLANYTENQSPFSVSAIAAMINPELAIQCIRFFTAAAFCCSFNARSKSLR